MVNRIFISYLKDDINDKNSEQTFFLKVVVSPSSYIQSKAFGADQLRSPETTIYKLNIFLYSLPPFISSDHDSVRSNLWLRLFHKLIFGK